jgi:outer membrane protein assembly factor BamA
MGPSARRERILSWVAFALALLGAFSSATSHAQTQPGDPASEPASAPSSEPTEIVVSLNPTSLPPDVVSAIPDTCLQPFVAIAGVNRLVSYTVGGTLVDSHDDVAAAISNDFDIGVPFDLNEAQRVAYKICQLNYIPVVDVSHVRGGINLAITLTPARIIRHVWIRYPDHPYLSRAIFKPVFDQDLLARMPLHPGSVLPSEQPGGDPSKVCPDPAARDSPTLLEAAKRCAQDSITDYLVSQGYFDANVTVDVAPGDGPQEANVTIELRNVWPGDGYVLGVVRVSGNSAVSTSEISAQLSHNTLFWKNPFSRDTLRDDLDTLTNLYHDRGYPEARFDFPQLGGQCSDPSGKGCSQLVLHPETHTVDVDLKVTEGRRVDVHYFVDGSEVEPGDMRNAITIFTSGSADTFALESSAYGLVHYFQSKGHLQAQVTFDHPTPADPTAPQTVNFYVQQGPERKVRELQVVGNNAVSSDDLLSELNTKLWPKILGTFGLGGGGYATADGLDGDEKTIEFTYHDQGFPLAQAHAEIAPDPAALGHAGALAADFAGGIGAAAQDLYVRYTVEEGPETVVGNVTFVGNDSVSSDDLLAALQYQPPGHPLVPEDIPKDITQLADLYGERGFPYVHIESNSGGSEMQEGKLAQNLVYTITEGPHTVMGHLFIRGNFKTASDIISRDFPLQPGDSFDDASIDNFREHLLGAGVPVSQRMTRLFRSVDIEYLGYNENPRDVLVRVSELYDDHGAIDVGVGYSSDECLNDLFSVDCLYLQATYTISNLFGQGWSLRLDARTGLRILLAPFEIRVPWIVAGTPIWSGAHPLESRLSVVDATFADPRLFGSYIQSAVSAFARQELTVRLGLVTTYGARWTLSDRYTDDLTLNAFYDVERINHPETATRTSGGLEYQTQIIVPTNVGTLSAGFLYDRRRITGMAPTEADYLRRIEPDSGWSLQGQASITKPFLWAPAQLIFGGTGSDFAILHLSGDYFHDLPLGFKLGTGFAYDHGIPLSGGGLLPKAEQFFAGGDTTMRGYLQDEFKRAIIQYEIPGAPNLIAYRVLPEGGNIRALGHLELMHPLGDFVPFGLLDVGYLIDSYAGFTANDVGASVGVGVRYHLPAGFVSMEYASPIPDLAEIFGGGVPLGDQRAPTLGVLIPGHLYLNFNYIY